MNIRLNERMLLNKNRLLNYDNTYKDVYKKDMSMSWPGDFIGRYSLALSSLYSALDKVSDKEEVLNELKKVVSERRKYVNKHFFMGPLFNDSLINEQQLSGNSWYIRSLVSYYRITGDSEILDEIKCIIEELLLKVWPHYSHYPLKDKREIGDVSGHTSLTPIDGFILSSDIGCAFILLDAYTDVYELTKDSRLKEAIEYIIDIFMKIDYVSLMCQTHATITCARSITRFYKLTNDTKYLDYARKIFSDYENYGMTLDYENINWFNKIDSWTEPCCVIDSFILAHDLYLITKDNKYLKLFGRISTNGPRIFERDNGGAGCASILYTKDSILKCHMYEAWFCCSMRFGEGLKCLSLSRLIELSKDKYLALYPDKYDKDGISLDIDYYCNKSIKVKSNKDIDLLIYIPDGFIVKSSNTEYEIKDNLINIKVSKDNEVLIECELSINKEKDIYFMGDMLLTRKDIHTDPIVLIDGMKYSYVLSSCEYKKEELEKISQFL